MHDPIAEALGMRPLGFSIDPNEGRDPNETTKNHGYISEEHYEWMSKAWASGDIRHREGFLKESSKRMKENNPMKNPETAKKVSESKKGTPAWNKGVPNPEQSKRMKENNPVHTHPEKHNFKNNSYVKGRKWYNNGEKNLYLYDHEEIPTGYTRGMKHVARKKQQ
jgi:hypothetical protein